MYYVYFDHCLSMHHTDN